MRYAGLVVLIVGLWATPLLASDEEIIALSEQSARAFSEGRYEEAQTAGEAAWRQAEQEWGPVEDTAFLADNLARQHLARGDRAAARGPAARVLELAEGGLTPSIPPAEARLLVAVANFDPAVPTKESVEELEAALIMADTEGVPPGQLLWFGWLDLARARLDAGDWRNAYAAGENVMNIMDLSAGVPDSAHTHAAIIAGSAAMQMADFQDAYDAFSWGRAYVRPIDTIDDGETINRDWAALSAWTAIASAMSFSTTGADVEVATDVFGLDEMDSSARCPDAKWVEQKPPEYPREALARGYVGAVVVEYEFAADGSVKDPKVLASVPDDYFAETLLDAMTTWRVDAASIQDCLGMKFVQSTEFAIDRHP